MDLSASQTELTPAAIAAIAEFHHFENEGMQRIRQSDQLITEAKMQLEDCIKSLVGRLNLEVQKRLPFNSAFEVNHLKH